MSFRTHICIYRAIVNDVASLIGNHGPKNISEHTKRTYKTNEIWKLYFPFVWGRNMISILKHKTDEIKRLLDKTRWVPGIATAYRHFFVCELLRIHFNWFNYDMIIQLACFVLVFSHKLYTHNLKGQPGAYNSCLHWV
jgi:hypothetical protein